MICLSMCSVWSFLCVFEHGFSQYQRSLSLIEVFHLLRDVQIVSFSHEMNMLSLQAFFISVSSSLSNISLCSSSLSGLKSGVPPLQASLFVFRRAWDYQPQGVHGEKCINYSYPHVMLPTIWYLLIFVFVSGLLIWHWPWLFNVSIDMLFGMAGGICNLSCDFSGYYARPSAFKV